MARCLEDAPPLETRPSPVQTTHLASTLADHEFGRKVRDTADPLSALVLDFIEALFELQARVFQDTKAETKSTAA